jgi:tetratricopeptide (TPR) repeat protein
MDVTHPELPWVAILTPQRQYSLPELFGLAFAFGILTGAIVPTHVQAEPRCGDLVNAIGPWDYQTASKEQRELIERFHFHQSTETLTGESVVGIAGDLSYTLHAFPNHPRALMAMAELALKEKRSTPKGSQYSVECWFDRAMRFRPQDGQVRLVYGIALLKTGQVQDAIERLKEAQQMLPNDGNVFYNLGLAYFEAKDYDKSAEYARKAYDAGFPLPGLRNMLQRVGKWQPGNVKSAPPPAADATETRAGSP